MTKPRGEPPPPRGSLALVLIGICVFVVAETTIGMFRPLWVVGSVPPVLVCLVIYVTLIRSKK